MKAFSKNNLMTAVMLGLGAAGLTPAATVQNSRTARELGNAYFTEERGNATRLAKRRAKNKVARASRKANR